MKDIKNKLAALKYPGTPKVILDTIRLLHEEIMGLQPHEESEYAALALEICKDLKASYKKQLVTNEVTAKQGDLEKLINDLASGVEKPWRNKLIDNGEH